MKSSANSRQRHGSEMALRSLECETTDCSFGTSSQHVNKTRKLKLIKSEFGEKRGAGRQC